jgi:hypothetical protein
MLGAHSTGGEAMTVDATKRHALLVLCKHRRATVTSAMRYGHR